MRSFGDTKQMGLGLRVLPLLVLILLAAVAAPVVEAKYQGSDRIEMPEDKQSRGTFVLDGSFVHNVGQLHMNITNWGLIGSRYTTRAPYADAPSAQWPAGSGVEYLWSAGLWVGAVKNGVPAVSTGQFQIEMLPTDDPLDTIYETRQGAPGGARYPDPGEDDDGDGLVNEDPINEIDDDGDGLIDEDFQAIGNQHFRFVNRDDTALSQEFYPDHEPLNIGIVQESFQWENESVDDFVGFQFQITNTGPSSLNDVFLGFFADCDIGPRDAAEVANDDLPGFFTVAQRAKDGSFVPLSVAYMYDADGDGGQSAGYFGIMFLNHDTDLSGETAPQQVGITTFQQFSGQAPFDRGGDPTNDSERYELLSRNEFDSFSTDEGKANDFRILMGTGPFVELETNESLNFQTAMVIGDGLDGLRRNAAEAALTYYGAYFDRDIDLTTGKGGRERRICIDDFGPRNASNPIFSTFQDCVDSLALVGENPPTPISEEELDADGCVYVNGDCDFEAVRTGGGNPANAIDCSEELTNPDPSLFAGCTGIEGKEFLVPWLVGLAPSPPNMRLWQTNNRIHLFWDNKSQLEKDVRLQAIDFESYRIWRADGWERPFGSSVDNGPESRLWRMVAEYDVVNSFESTRDLRGGGEQTEILPLGSNTGLGDIRYTPVVLREGSRESIEFAELAALLDQILREEQGITPATPIRYRDPEGNVTGLGERYPELANWEQSYANLDTVAWSKLDPPVEFFEFVDRDVHNGIYYFYAVTATDFTLDPQNPDVPTGPGLSGDPQSNFDFASPQSDAQTREERAEFGRNIFVVPNPATREALSQFSELNPNSDDPTGIRVEFRNLPRARNTVRVFTLSGDLVAEIPHDGSGGTGSLAWNLVSRNGQEVVSGIYMYSVQSEDANFNDVVGKFVVIR